MKFAIADPPYLGRGARWYGDGRGHFTRQRNSDHHPAASEWDSPERHVALVRELVASYDGWAIAGAPDSLDVYRAVVPTETRTMVWHRGNSIPSGARVASRWEFVLAFIPEQLRGHGSGLGVSDVLVCGVDNRSGFTGSKPAEWTRWVLAALGYDPARDTVDDLFPGSGRVAAAAEVLL